MAGKVFQNAQWIIAAKVIQSLLQMIIGMLTARFLGPSNYGLINYAASIVAFMVPVMQLGLRATLVLEYVENPIKQGEVLGTSLLMNLISAVLSIVAVICFVSVANRTEPETILVCLLYSLSLVAQAIEMVQYWFQFRLQSKYPSTVMLVAYLAVSLYKSYLLIYQKSIYWFALSHTIEYSLVGIGLLLVYRKLKGPRLQVSWSTAKCMFERSKYYILSGLMVTIFQSTDHVMLKMMIGDAENGFYTTAVTCAGITTFVFLAIIDSARPELLAVKNNEQQFEQGISSLYCVIIYLSLAQCIAFTLLANLIVYILYGSEYLPAAPVLRIVVWYTIFSCMGTIRNIWILAKGKQSLLWIINLSGALMNILLNSILIPQWGACGAALASVVTQFFTNYIVGFFIKPIRRNNYLVIRGLSPHLILYFLKH